MPVPVADNDWGDMPVCVCLPDMLGAFGLPGTDALRKAPCTPGLCVILGMSAALACWVSC